VMYLLKALGELPLINHSIGPNGRELLHPETKHTLPVDKRLRMDPYDRGTLRA
jgi:hypothetical protein